MILGAGFAGAAFWVAVGPMVRAGMRIFRGPARASTPAATAADAEISSSKASRAA